MEKIIQAMEIEMEAEDKERLISLGNACAGMRAELEGIKEILTTLSSNQAELIKIREKSIHLEEGFRFARKEHDGMFTSIRGLEDVRAQDRIRSLESNQRWLVIAILGAVIATVIRAVL